MGIRFKEMIAQHSKISWHATVVVTPPSFTLIAQTFALLQYTQPNRLSKY
jgi:hypothetical protein